VSWSEQPPCLHEDWIRTPLPDGGLRFRCLDCGEVSDVEPQPD
jgi:hypothetical protein